MTWKQKEKELTPDEAIQLAKSELTPFWLGSPPLIAGVRYNDRNIVVPLDLNFAKKTWLIVFADSTAFNGETSIYYLKEWHRRYHTNHLYMLLVYSSPYSYFKNLEFLRRQKEWQSLGFPVVIDLDGALASAFEASELTKLVLFHQNKIQFSHSGQNWLNETELKIQNFLRTNDPGLPLLPLFDFHGKVNLARDLHQLEFGYQPRHGQVAKFFPPSFQAQEESEIRIGNFTTPLHEKLSADQIFISGKWSQDSERIYTSDPNASICFRSSAPRVSIIAQSLDRGPDLGVAIVEVDGTPVYEAIAGEHLILEDSGRSLVKFGIPHLFHLLTGENDGKQRDVVLRFIHAKSVPVAVYGLRFGVGC